MAINTSMMTINDASDVGIAITDGPAIIAIAKKKINQSKKVKTLQFPIKSAELQGFLSWTLNPLNVLYRKIPKTVW